ncbi:uncharacterized protein N7473_000434 [Penicillium subrubescens]|uniref:uncharacterized protein n=1 Tax=Penicillium subrubescens TaxID=1316194 RepID=UPI002545AB3E|nr:uncharacterized protein N7473_000434 [Penicillium subrubescens]KAJ5911131.1 hypothetical protein N7473_000434 [Penicillium subrubescens]
MLSSPSTTIPWHATLLSVISIGTTPGLAPPAAPLLAIGPVADKGDHADQHSGMPTPASLSLMSSTSRLGPTTLAPPGNVNFDVLGFVDATVMLCNTDI